MASEVTPLALLNKTTTAELKQKSFKKCLHLCKLSKEQTANIYSRKLENLLNLFFLQLTVAFAP